MIIRLSLRRLILPLVGTLLILTPALILLGRALTPTPARIVTWTDWQVRQARDAYAAELADLRRDAAVLADLLNADVPDPVQAQLVANQIALRWRQGQPALSVRRDGLITAAQAVSDWAVGALPRETARQVVAEQLAALAEVERGLESR